MQIAVREGEKARGERERESWRPVHDSNCNLTQIFLET
jgi:hypothetical protein